MKLSLMTTLLTILTLSSAAPVSQNGIQKEVPEPAMSVGGIPTAFENRPGIGTKIKRQVAVGSPAMTVNGQVVPYQNTAGSTGTRTKNKRQVDVNAPAMTRNGQVVPFSNSGS